MDYLKALHRERIRPDALLVQSWYEEPTTYIPESQPYTMTNTALEAAELIDSLYRIK